MDSSHWQYQLSLLSTLNLVNTILHGHLHMGQQPYMHKYKLSDKHLDHLQMCHCATGSASTHLQCNRHNMYLRTVRYVHTYLICIVYNVAKCAHVRVTYGQSTKYLKTSHVITLYHLIARFKCAYNAHVKTSGCPWSKLFHVTNRHGNARWHG